MSKVVYNSDGTYNYAYSLFHEEPSKPLAYMAAGAFAIIFVAHMIQAIRLRTIYMAALIVGVFFEAAGYGARISAINNPFSIATYAGQQGLIVISPVLIAASQYIMMEKIMQFVDEKASPVRPSLIAKIFVTSDVISFAVQGAGSGILVASSSSFTLGNNILIAGLVLQVVCYITFLTISTIFFSRVYSREFIDAGWKKLYTALFISCALILIRSVFRVVEFAVGYDGPIATNENYMYGFDFALIVIGVVILNVYHPGNFIKTPPRRRVDMEMVSTPGATPLVRDVTNENSSHPPYQAIN
ncbi:hypothetical protein HDU84_002401 [Entophlyctis sp. JEL0112]|nr:hypothetical protein HDU84_002401 [Entophlyctis sp. JEL0112]